MKKFLMPFFLIITIPILASNLTDYAYKEYKKHHYKKAFEIYQEATKKDKDRLSLVKAHYNLGVFYYKGLGVKKDLYEAKINFDVAVMLREMIISHVIGDVAYTVTYEEANTTTKKLIKIANKAKRYIKKIQKYCQKHPNECKNINY